MAKHKVTRKELEQDELAQALQDFANNLRRNRFKILIIGTLSVVLVASGAFFLRNRAERANRNAQILTTAIVVFGELPGLQDEATRKTRLENTINILQSIIDDSPNSISGRMALYVQGNCLFYKADPLDQEAFMADLEAAKEKYELYIALAKNDEERARGEIALGYTLENQLYLDEDMAKLDQALAHYVRGADKAPEGSYLFYYALLNQARVLEVRSRDTEAMEIYQRIMADRPSPSASETTDDAAFPNDPFGGGIQQLLQTQFDPLSFYSTAKLRSERLEATSNVLTPADSGL